MLSFSARPVYVFAFEIMPAALQLLDQDDLAGEACASRAWRSSWARISPGEFMPSCPRGSRRADCAEAGRLLAMVCSTKFAVSEADAAAIREAFDRAGELAAALEVRRRFPVITDNTQARICARTIAGWKPPPVPRDPPATVTQLRPDRRTPG
jgi:hypothetical protein